VKVDPGLLRKGLNVLAIELHRSRLPLECVTGNLETFAPIKTTPVESASRPKRIGRVGSDARPGAR
jgi:hypothetical protein